MRRSRPLVTLVALAALLGLPACGQEPDEPQQFQAENAQAAETEGIYVDVDELKYQVQVSRQLNPLIVNDRAYFEGVSRFDRELEADEVWFGIWMRVENDTDEPLRSAEDFLIRDTQENVYRPLEIGPTSAWAYRAGPVDGQEIYPLGNTAAGERSPAGALLLFKVRRFSLDNRPLELEINGRESRATVNLDV